MPARSVTHERWGTWCWVLVTVAELLLVVSTDSLSVNVDVTGPKQRLPHFWASTGFSPPKSGKTAREFLGSSSVAKNLNIIGALPRNSVRQVRVHWLLDLLEPVRSDGRVTWKYQLLDDFLKKVVNSGLIPRFELMGNPGGIFTNLADKTQAATWRDMVRSIAERYAGFYGRQEVSKWSFESWNEPDLRQYNIINMTLPAYLSYFNASVQGLRDAEKTQPGLRFPLSGPAGLFKKKTKHPLCWGLLEYCNRLESRNLSCGLSEITYHHKGNNSVEEILLGGLQLARKLKQDMPYLKHLPLSNDEADHLSGWWRPLAWREDVRMAAMIVTSVNLHLNWAIRRKPTVFRLLGGDHGFLSQPPNYFNQRTLLARFPINENNEQIFRKPSLGALVLLGMLGHNRIKTDVTGEDDRLSVIATSDWNVKKKYDWTVEILLTMSDDTKQNASARTTVNLTISAFPNRFSGAIYRVLQLSSALPHPASIWDAAGRPTQPNAALRAKMRKAEGPHIIKSEYPIGTDKMYLNLSLSLALPSVTLVQVCGQSRIFPGRVSGLRAVNVTYNEVLLIFKDSQVKSKCILTYQVEFCKGQTKTTCTLLKDRIIYLAYHYAPDPDSEYEAVRGRYRVRAIDVWGRPGRFSKPIFYGS